MAKAARQVDFDQIVKDIVQSGNSWEEAAIEALETFEESNYDISGLFVYRSKVEYEEKEQLEKRCRTIEDVSTGKATVVNMIFALQGLTQKLNSPAGKMTMKLLESRNILNSLLQSLTIFRASDEDEENSNGEGDDSDEDEDENKILQKTEIWKFIQFLLTLNQSLYLNYHNLLTLTEASVAMIHRTLDEDSDEIRIIELVLKVLPLLLLQETNRLAFQETNLPTGLNLIKKLHKKNAAVQTQVDQILASL